MASHVHELIEIAALRPAAASVVRTLLDGITASNRSTSRRPRRFRLERPLLIR